MGGKVSRNQAGKEADPKCQDFPKPYKAGDII